jgi:GNAT superfamily N-acetyltransferase
MGQPAACADRLDPESVFVIIDVARHRGDRGSSSRAKKAEAEGQACARRSSGRVHPDIQKTEATNQNSDQSSQDSKDRQPGDELYEDTGGGHQSEPSKGHDLGGNAKFLHRPKLRHFRKSVNDEGDSLAGIKENGCAVSSIGFQLRALTPDDWQAYRDVRLRSLQIDPKCLGRTYEQEAGGTEAQWRAFLEEHATFVAVVAACLVGTICIGQSVTYSGVAEIINVWVHPDLRGHGIGEAQITRALDWAKRNGMHQVLLKVNEGCEDAQRLYGRRGFKYLPKSALTGPHEHEMSLSI